MMLGVLLNVAACTVSGMYVCIFKTVTVCVWYYMCGTVYVSFV